MRVDTPKRRPWTFMVYMAGDNGRVFDTPTGSLKLMEEMTSAGYEDLAEMSQVGTTERCAVACLFDSLDGSFLIEVRKGSGLADCLVERLEDVNTGDPETLSRFVLRSVELYPAEHYALVIWNHGTGWLDVDPYSQVRLAGSPHARFSPIFRSTLQRLAGGPTRAIAFDDSSKDFLDAAGLREALGKASAQTGRLVDLIGMDACLMAMVEGARELAPYARYFVASQEVEPMQGWPYDRILTVLNEEPTTPPSVLAERIVREYAEAYGAKTRAGVGSVTLSAVDLSRSAETEALCQDLVRAIMVHDSRTTLQPRISSARDLALQFQDRSYCDLGDFARRVAEVANLPTHAEVRAAALALYRHLEERGPDSTILQLTYRASKYRDATGLSVYLPSRSQPRDQRDRGLVAYRDLAFAKATGWDRVVEWLWEEPKKPPADLPLPQPIAAHYDAPIDTLKEVLEALLQALPVLFGGARQAILAQIRAFGPAIAGAREWDLPDLASRASDLLLGLAELGPLLPAEVRAALAPRQASDSSPHHAPDAHDRNRIVALMEAVMGHLSPFDDPQAVAAEVELLVSEHEERLTSEERARWRQLRHTLGLTHEAEAFLHQVEGLLGGYALVRGLLDSHRVTLGEASRVVGTRGGIGAGPDAFMSGSGSRGSSEQAAMPILELHAALSGDCRTITYTLHSSPGGDYHFAPMGSVELAAEPRMLMQPVVERLRVLADWGKADRKRVESSRVTEEMAEIGRHLYDRLFSPQLKQEYRRIRVESEYLGAKLRITSDDPWIPWEIIKPYETDGTGAILYDDPYLSVSYCMSRWFPGRTAPSRVRIKKAAWVAAKDDAEAAGAEPAYFEDLRRRRWELELVGPLSSADEVEALLAQGEIGLLHFACSGCTGGGPDDSRVQPASTLLGSEPIVGPVAAGLRQAGPLIFMSTCFAPDPERLTAQEALRPKHLIEAGAGALVHPQWGVSELQAARFALEFYDRLFGVGDFPEPLVLGEALREARLALQASNPADPTCMAYVLYGDPNARVVLG